MKRLLVSPLLLILACKSAPPPAPAPEPAAEAPKAAAAAPVPAASAAIAPPTADPSLPARVVYTGNPDFQAPTVSPNGKYFAYLGPRDGVMNVFLAPISAPTKAEPLTQEKVRPIRRYHWAFDGQHLLYEQDKAGDENFHLFAVDLKTKVVRDLTDLPKTRAFLVQLSSAKPKEMLVELNDRDPRYHDLYKVELASGKRTLIFKNEAGYSDLLADDALQLRVLAKQRDDGGKDVFKVDPKGAISPLWTVPMEDALTTDAWGFDASGKTLYLVDTRERDLAGAFAYDMASGKKTLLAEDPKANVFDALFHPKTGKLQAAAVNYERPRWIAVDKSIEADLATLAKELKGDLFVSSRSLDDMTWVVLDSVDNGPVRYFLYDHATRKTTFLFTNRKSLEGMKLSRMHPRIIKARDGLELVSYLSLPPGSDEDGDGKPASAVPLVLLVHGGPWARDSWGFNPTHQWLASRGYGVLSVNYRGSEGFGKRFLNAANGEWAGKMHDDLIDAVEWVVKEGIAPKDKIAIMGGSYGGYATLVGLTFTPDTFACGVDIVGPSNLQTLLETIPPYWAPMLNQFVMRIGEFRTDDGKKQLATRSPLSLVDKIRRPLLIGQGANDPRVKQSESDQIVKAMSEKKIPVTYVLFSDEGHGFARPENRLAFNAVAETFLAQCLGGRYQPVGQDFAGSSIAVPTGQAAITGLTEALGAKGGAPAVAP